MSNTYSVTKFWFLKQAVEWEIENGLDLEFNEEVQEDLAWLDRFLLEEPDIDETETFQESIYNDDFFLWEFMWMFASWYNEEMRMDADSGVWFEWLDNRSGYFKTVKGICEPGPIHDVLNEQSGSYSFIIDNETGKITFLLP